MKKLRTFWRTPEAFMIYLKVKELYLETSTAEIAFKTALIYFS